MSYSGSRTARRTRRVTFVMAGLLTLATACNMAGYGEAPELPDREISVSPVVVPDPETRQVIQDHIDEGARYTGDIRRLDLSATRTGGADRNRTIEGIQQFRNLLYLDLRGQRLRSGQMVYLAGMVSLEELYLDHNRIDSFSLGDLAGLERLRVLSLRSNNVAEFSMLSNVPGLEVLDLSHNDRLQDDPLPFASFGALRRLILEGTPRMDARAIAQLKRLRPDMEIVWP